MPEHELHELHHITQVTSKENLAGVKWVCDSESDKEGPWEPLLDQRSYASAFSGTRDRGRGTRNHHMASHGTAPSVILFSDHLIHLPHHLDLASEPKDTVPLGRVRILSLFRTHQ